MNRLNSVLRTEELTRAELARAAGLSSSSIHRYATNKAQPTAKSAARVIRGLASLGVEGVRAGEIFPAGSIHRGVESCSCRRNSIKKILQNVFHRNDVERKKLADMGLDDNKKTRIRMDINGCCANFIDPDFADSDVRASDTLDTLWARVEQQRM